MSENAEDNDPPPAASRGKPARCGRKKISATADVDLDQVYRKMSQREHVLARPESYLGSTDPLREIMWIYDAGEHSFTLKEVSYVPALYKLYDEIIMNAIDNSRRDPTMNTIKVEINKDKNELSVLNNGQGLRVVKRKKEDMYLPSFLFGELLTSSNFDDKEKKLTGGRNGYGAKLCNIFSSKFSVETFSTTDKKFFKQDWSNNMSETTTPVVKRRLKGEDYTKVTFSPDLSRFKMEELDPDTVALLSRRAFDIAGCVEGIKVHLNGYQLPVDNFVDYVQLFVRGEPDEPGKHRRIVYERVNERWELAVMPSESGDFQQISFVNGVCTKKGGTHVDHVVDRLVKEISEHIGRTYKEYGGLIVKRHVKEQLRIFINCLIENPTFDSQVKDCMTLHVKKFGSKCDLSEDFCTKVTECGIVEQVIDSINSKAQRQWDVRAPKKRGTKLKDMSKLQDASYAGTAKSLECTLIVTEGDSAKTMAVSGLAIIGRERYGVFPLKGKIMNTRGATVEQILKNEELRNLIKILGLELDREYDCDKDMSTLRYGHLMLMCDQDFDGSHIKGLLINFLHTMWPSLLKQGFLEEFITPIVKVVLPKGVEHCFYSVPEYEAWKKRNQNWERAKVKYYKGLGTNTSREAKIYFENFSSHRIRFVYEGEEDDKAIKMAFSPNMVQERKAWLNNFMEDRRSRKEDGRPDSYLYGKGTESITYQDFINTELIMFSNLDNERSIPSVMDGLKPGQRKVLYACLRRNDKQEVKVAQLAGSVAYQSAYHHGEASLMSTIIHMAQDFIGSNNVNLLLPIGQFGTRLQGGKDAANPRYIYTLLSPIARLIFTEQDDAVLNYLYEDNEMIEPEYFIPVVPMVLVNGAEGIGTGWSTRIPSYNPRDIAKNLVRMMDGKDPVPLKPWFKNFQGSVDQIRDNHFVTSGEVAILTDNMIEITELPIRTWTETYKETVLDRMLLSTNKTSPSILEYQEFHTDKTVRFVVKMKKNELKKARKMGLHKVFKLQAGLTTSSMVLFNSQGVLTTYRTPEEILVEFYDTRLKTYQKQQNYREGLLLAELRKLENQVNFIQDVINEDLRIMNKPQKRVIELLKGKGYASDPVAEWKKRNKTLSQQTAEEEKKDNDVAAYNYLLGMQMWNVTSEKVKEVQKKKEQKKLELEELQKKMPRDIWKQDLEALMTKLSELEELDRTKALRGGGKKIETDKTQPSPFGERVVPSLEFYNKKISKPAKPDREKKSDHSQNEYERADCLVLPNYTTQEEEEGDDEMSEGRLEENMLQEEKSFESSPVLEEICEGCPESSDFDSDGAVSNLEPLMEKQSFGTASDSPSDISEANAGGSKTAVTSCETKAGGRGTCPTPAKAAEKKGLGKKSVQSDTQKTAPTFKHASCPAPSKASPKKSVGEKSRVKSTLDIKNQNKTKKATPGKAAPVPKPAALRPRKKKEPDLDAAQKKATSSSDDDKDVAA